MTINAPVSNPLKKKLLHLPVKINIHEAIWHHQSTEKFKLLPNESIYMGVTNINLIGHLALTFWMDGDYNINKSWQLSDTLYDEDFCWWNKGKMDCIILPILIEFHMCSMRVPLYILI